jgi:hypothetical protein
VWTLGVVVLEVVDEHPAEVVLVAEQEPVEAFAADGADEALRVGAGDRRADRREDDADRLAREDLVEDAGELAVAITDEEPEPVEGASIARLRTCRATHAPVAVRVMPARWTRRVSSSMKNSTLTRRGKIVSTQKKSRAMMPRACAWRNWRQVGPSRRGAGLTPALSSIRRTVLGEAVMPSFASSPLIRG